MPYYEELCTGIWKVKINEQFLWHFLRKNEMSVGFVEMLSYLVEDKLNMYDHRVSSIDIPCIIKTCYSKCQKLSSKK